MSSSENLLLLLFALFLVALNGFFVASEFAIVKLRHTRVEELRKLHGFRGRILSKVHRQLDAYLSACQLGITLASLGLGWVGEPAFASLLEAPLKALGWDNDPERVHTIAFIFAFGTISYLHIVLGELAPKSAALRKPEAMSLWTAVPLYLFYWAMFPFIWGLNASANWILRRAGLGEGGGHGHEVPYSNDELRMILHLSRGASEGAEGELNRLLAHTLEMPKLHASDVMRNRRELVTIPADATHTEAQRLLLLHRYSRYPCVLPDSGEVIGLLLLKDLYLEGPGEDFTARLHDNLLPLERVRENFSIAELLRRFRSGVPHLALVEDADAHVIGFVTMEDVLEAIFGDIADEHEQERSGQINREPKAMEDGTWLLRGDTPLFRLERALAMTIPESEELSTVTGLLMERLGKLPSSGESIVIGPYTATVLKTRGTQIEAVRVAATPTEPEAG